MPTFWAMYEPRIDASDFSHATDTERSNGYLTRLRALQVTNGVAYGEEVGDVDHLSLGDFYKVSIEIANLSVAFSDAESWRFQVFLEHSEVGPSVMTAQILKSAVLMSEFGQTVNAYVVQGAVNSQRELFLLHSVPLTAIAQYVVIDIEPDIRRASDQHPGDTEAAVLALY